VIRTTPSVPPTTRQEVSCFNAERKALNQEMFAQARGRHVGLVAFLLKGIGSVEETGR
jgi:hypothetical protein